MRKFYLPTVSFLLVLFYRDVYANKLIWGDGNRGTANYIKSCNLDGSDVRTVIQLTTGYYGAMDLDVDKTNSNIYWTSAMGYIERCNFDGSGYQRITQLTNAWLEGIFVNEINSKIYFVNGNITDAICRINFDGSGYTQVVNEYVKCFLRHRRQ